MLLAANEAADTAIDDATAAEALAAASLSEPRLMLWLSEEAEAEAEAEDNDIDEDREDAEDDAGADAAAAASFAMRSFFETSPALRLRVMPAMRTIKDRNPTPRSQMRTLSM